MDAFLASLFSIAFHGLAYGMILYAISVGLSVTMGLMGFVNLAHGAFAMIGGYATALLTREAHWSFWLAVPVAVAGTAAGVGPDEHPPGRREPATDGQPELAPPGPGGR